MSDSPDHSHSGPGHHHHHGHDHDHDHDHDHGPSTPPKGPPAAPPPPPSASGDDAGSQALAEALGSSFVIVRLLMIGLVALFFFKCFFILGPQEKAVVLRFGKPIGVGNAALLTAGWHFALPFPIDEVKRIPFQEIQKVTSTTGWFFVPKEMEDAGNDPQVGPNMNLAADGYVITGDTNIVHSRAFLSYRIEDPIRFAFDYVNATNAIQSVLDNALIYVAAHSQVDRIIRDDVAGFQDRVQARVNQLVRTYNLGIAVEQCRVESRAPLYLKKSFEEVNNALSTRDKMRNDAKSYENGTLSRAEAEAAGRRSRAQAESVQLVSQVRADAQQFLDILPLYQSNPDLYHHLLLAEKIGQVLTNVQDKWYLPQRTDGKTREVRLQLSREPLKPATSLNGNQ